MGYFLRETMTFQGGLYPTIAVSDAFNAAMHASAALIIHKQYPCDPAALGFATVAVAATVGTARFGYSESMFANANGDLADLAAMVGLPLVGLSFAKKWGMISLTPRGELALAMGLACLNAYMSRTASDGAKEVGWRAARRRRRWWWTPVVVCVAMVAVVLFLTCPILTTPLPLSHPLQCSNLLCTKKEKES